MCMNELRDIFINNLKYFRKKHRLSQENLSKAIGMSSTYINQVENKNCWPQPEILEKICKELEILPSQLFRNDSCPENFIICKKEIIIEEISQKMNQLIYENIRTNLKNTIEEIIKQ